MDYENIINFLNSHANPKNVEGMKRFGIQGGKMLGISVVELRKRAKKIGKNHTLALKLWNSKIHEARILSSMIDEPDKVTEKQMNKWTADFDSWDICDQVCSNLYDKTPFAYKKIVEWAVDDREFVRRASFALIAVMAVHDKKASDSQFIRFFPLIKKYATDERNFVKKAVNWALRQIGKRNNELKKKTLVVAEEILTMDSKSARWIARDAIRELRGR